MCFTENPVKISVRFDPASKSQLNLLMNIKIGDICSKMVD